MVPAAVNRRVLWTQGAFLHHPSPANARRTGL